MLITTKVPHFEVVITGIKRITERGRGLRRPRRASIASLIARKPIFVKPAADGDGEIFVLFVIPGTRPCMMSF